MYLIYPKDVAWDPAQYILQITRLVWLVIVSQNSELFAIGSGGKSLELKIRLSGSTIAQLQTSWVILDGNLNILSITEMMSQVPFSKEGSNWSFRIWMVNVILIKGQSTNK